MNRQAEMESFPDFQSYKMSRRIFLKTSTTAATALIASNILSGCLPPTPLPPPNFPETIELYQQAFESWSREIIVPNIWFCSPQTADDVVTLANWANENNFRLRPFGSGHGFSPALMPRDDAGEDVVLVNTSDFLKGIDINSGSGIPSVTAGAGALLEDICKALETYDLGLYHTPAPGTVTIAGALAMNVHGAALPANGETLQPGHSWGTLSNLVLSLTAVVWDAGTNEYVLRTFQRDDPAIGPLLTCIARSFITEVTLQVGPNLKIRCQSRTDLTLDELFAAPSLQGANSFANLSQQLGTVDALYWPFVSTGNAWVKSWTPVANKPSTSREVLAPYNYTSPPIPPAAADLIAKALRDNPSNVPSYNTLTMQNIEAQVNNTDPATQIKDIWGSAYTTTFYAPTKTPRNTVAAWGVIISRLDLQRALNEFHTYISSLISDFASQGLFPYTGPIEIRAHGLDRPDDVLIPNAVEPFLSGARPHPDHPEKDIIVWFAINNNVDQPEADDFNTLLEDWFLSNYQSYGLVRPEWTKGHAYTINGVYGGAWTSIAKLTQTFPNTFRGGYPSGSNWDAAVAAIKAHDPHGVFSNSYLDVLFSS